MRLISVIWKTILCQLRDYWALLLTIALSPFFVFIYWLITETTSFTYNVLVINNDSSYTQTYNYSEDIVTGLLSLKNSDEKSFMRINSINSKSEAQKLISAKKADILIMFDSGFSKHLKNIIIRKDSTLPSIHIMGDASSPKYASALILTLSSIQTYIDAITGNKQMYSFTEEFIGSSEKLNEFQIYIPGLIVLSIIMLLFTTALSLVREIEDKTLQRLMITKMTVRDYILGNSITQIVIGIISVTTTFSVAHGLGFTTNGSLVVASIICIITLISVIGVSLMVVAFSKSVSTVLSFGNFPLFILMFFSGAMMPIPRTELFSIAGHGIAFPDLLPPSHATSALHKILNLGQSIGEIKSELLALSILSFAYFAIGMWLFGMKHLKTKV